LKVAIFCPYDFSFPGGVQTQALDLAVSLKNKGQNVFLFAPLSDKNIHEINDIPFFNLGKPFTFSFLGSKSRISINIIKILKISNYLNKNDFDIIHLNEPLSPTYLLLIYLVRKIKIVGTFHAYGEKKHFWYFYFKSFLNFFLKKIDYKICVSNSSQKYINRYFDFESIIIPNGINLQKYRDIKEKPKILRNSNKKILFVGRFEEQRKGFNLLLNSFNKLSKEIKNLDLIVAGPGNSKNFKIKNPNADFNKISIIGTVLQSELPSFYKNVDVICLPSLENESFGVIILEAMASGKILVLSNIESYKELSEKNNYGFLYTYNSTEDLYNLLYNLLNKKISVGKNIKNGLKNVQNYSWDYLVSEIINIYKKLLK